MPEENESEEKEKKSKESKGESEISSTTDSSPSSSSRASEPITGSGFSFEETTTTEPITPTIQPTPTPTPTPTATPTAPEPVTAETLEGAVEDTESRRRRTEEAVDERPIYRPSIYDGQVRQEDIESMHPTARGEFELRRRVAPKEDTLKSMTHVLPPIIGDRDANTQLIPARGRQFQSEEIIQYRHEKRRSDLPGDSDEGHPGKKKDKHKVTEYEEIRQ